jgi:hypothetical protein
MDRGLFNYGKLDDFNLVLRGQFIRNLLQFRETSSDLELDVGHMVHFPQFQIFILLITLHPYKTADLKELARFLI